tara:strand:+ start:9361 stop:10527 length:1167 start_codon:yes stop_codon:yes gene_type:complete
MEEQFEKAEIFDTPQELAASMQADAQKTETTTTEEAPQQESQSVEETSTPEVAPQSEPQVELTQEQTSEPVQEESKYQATTDDNIENQASTDNDNTTQQYSDNDIESAVFNYVSERLGREVKSFEDFSQPQNAMDERIQKIAEFVQNTGRAPEDWFKYQSLNPSEMDDLTAVRIKYSQDYPQLNFNEINTLIGAKYKMNPDEFSEDDIKVSALQLKIDGTDARKNIEEIRNTYAAPIQKETSEQPKESYFTKDWVQNMQRETTSFEGLEFDLGNGKNFNFGVGENYRKTLVDSHQNAENYLDRYKDTNGNWDYDSFNSHQTLIDNIDNIVSSAYRQGMGDGQRGLVDKAANVSTNTPSQNTAQNNTNSLAEQVKNIMGSNSNKMTFNI